MHRNTLLIADEAMTRRQRWTMFVASTSGALETSDMVIFGFFAQQTRRAFFPSGDGSAYCVERRAGIHCIVFYRNAGSESGPAGVIA